MTTKQPQTASEYNEQGLHLKSLGRVQEAIACYDKAIKINAEFAPAYNNKGVALKDAGNIRGAILLYDEAIQLDKNYTDAYKNKGFALKKLRMVDEAIACYDKAIKLNPNYADGYYCKGLALEYQRKYQEAATCFDKVIKLNPDYAEGYHCKGLALYDLGNAQESVHWFDEAIKRNPNNPVFYKSKGLACEKTGNLQEAITCYDEAIKLDPNYAVWYCYKGKALNSLGRGTLALQCFKKAHELNKNGANGRYLKEWEAELINTTLKNERETFLEELTVLQQASVETLKLSKKLNSANQDEAALMGVVQKLIGEKDKLTHQLIACLDQSLSSIEGSTVAVLQFDLSETKKKLDEVTKQMQDFRLAQDSKNQQVDQQLGKHENALEKGGVYEKVAVKEGFENLAKEDPRLYIYCKTFYWTSINLFGAYRALSTGIVQGDLDYDISHKENVMGKGAKALTVYGVEICKEIPFLGGLIRALDLIIEDIHNSFKEARLIKKVNAVNRVIQDKFTLEDDISLYIAKLALSVTNKRRKLICYPGMKKEAPVDIEHGLQWLNGRVEAAMGQVIPTVELHNQENMSIAQALSDVTLMMAFLCKNSESVILNKKPLDEQCEDIIEYGFLDQMVGAVAKDGKGPEVSLQGANENPKQCCQTCNMF